MQILSDLMWLKEMASGLEEMPDPSMASLSQWQQFVLDYRTQWTKYLKKAAETATERQCAQVEHWSRHQCRWGQKSSLFIVQPGSTTHDCQRVESSHGRHDAQLRAEYKRAGHRSSWAREPWIRVSGPRPPEAHRSTLTSEQCRQLIKEAEQAASSF